MAERKYRAKTDFILRKIDGSNVLISTGENLASFNGYIEMNDTACFIWETLAEEKSEAELLAIMREYYETDPEQLEKDVCEFLEEMQTYQMLEVL